MPTAFLVSEQLTTFNQKAIALITSLVNCDRSKSQIKNAITFFKFLIEPFYYFIAIFKCYL